MGFGDEILAAGQAQRLYDADAQHRRVVIRDIHGKLRTHPIWAGNPAIATDDIHGDSVQSLVSAPYARPYLLTQPMTPESGWVFNPDFRARDHLAKIYLTESEWQLGLDAKANFGAYVLIEPYSKHPNLRWPLAHWQTLVADRSDLTFLQHTHAAAKDFLVPGAVPIETNSFREACGLLSAADCYIRGESGMLHAAAALGIPSVAIWGGCMDWEVLGGYPQQVGVGITPPCCGSYLPCAHCASIMAAIPPSEVSTSIALACRWAGRVAVQ